MCLMTGATCEQACLCTVYLVIFPIESQYESLLARFYDSETKKHN